MHLQYLIFIAMRLTLSTSTKIFFKQILPYIFYSMSKQRILQAFLHSAFYRTLLNERNVRPSLTE